MYLHQTIQSSRGGRALVMISVLILAASALFAMQPISAPGSMPASALNLDLLNLPLSFIPNQGQINSAVLYQVQNLDGTLSFTQAGVALSLPSTQKSDPSVLRVNFTGANSAPVVSGGERLQGVVNYLIGNDPSRWHTNLPTFASITYQQLYPGIDLSYDGTFGALKGTYTIAQGADPSLIRWHHAGAANVSLDEASGNLLIILASTRKGASQTVTESAPIAWQIVNGQRVDVDVHYAVAEDGSVGFALGAYDSTLPLVIDPTLVYSTYLGGANFEAAEGIALDNDGNVYVTGLTNSTNFPAQNPIYAYGSGDDAFVVKINAAGDAMLYSTYIGGNGDDSGNDIAVDANGSAYIVGDTDSTNFPTQNAYQRGCKLFMGSCNGDAFISKLDASGSSLLYSSYLGGNFPDDAEGIAVEDSGRATMIGSTASKDFPTVSPLQASLKGPYDAFVAAMDTTQAGPGSLVYSTFLGGSSNDYGAAVALDGGGDIYVTGQTISTDFPTQNHLQSAFAGSNDIFVAKIKADGSALDYSSYLGGSGADYGYDIAVDSAGSVYLTGNTESTNFPTQNPLQAVNMGLSDAFVAKIKDDGSALDYSTYLGGSDADYGYGIAVDSSNNAYVTGNTNSVNFPVERLMQVYGGNGDAFIAKLSADGSALDYSTYLGGSDADFGDNIALDNAGNAYVAGITFSTNFPTQNPIQDTLAGSSDVFVAKINDLGDGIPVPTPVSGPDLSNSYKSASQKTLGPGEVLTYTIQLINTGTVTATANVTDPVPSELEFIPESLTGEGSYEASTQTLSWMNVDVAPGADVALSFAVTPAITVTSPTVVLNQATIEYNGANLDRRVGIALIPEVWPAPNLAGAFKAASQHTLASGEQLTYTVRLYNSGTITATAAVTDPVPDKLAYVDGSASGNGSYDANTRIVTWSDLSVPPASSATLTFAVTPAVTVTTPTKVVNIATIDSDGVTFKRQTPVVLVPYPLTTDSISPVVNGITIDDKDVFTSTSVTLHISATDNVGVQWMYLQEWSLASDPVPHWQVVQSSDWVPFQADFPWTLGPANGVHFVGVWVADGALNRSQLDRQALDYASLVQPGVMVGNRGLVPYLVHYEAGADVSITLTPTLGDVDLYVWYPNNFSIPDQESVLPGSATESIHFVTPEAGDYLILVHGYTSATYDLSITPSGGPQALLMAVGGQAASNTATSNKKDALSSEPVLTMSGLDPLGTYTAAAPSGPYVLFMPILTR